MSRPRQKPPPGRPRRSVAFVQPSLPEALKPLECWHELGADDPGRIIERAFVGRMAGHDLDEVVLAWLAVLPPGRDPRQAADRLHRRLAAQRAARTPRQDRLLALLEFIARVGPADAASHQ